MADNQVTDYHSTPYFRGVEAIRKNWGWFFVLGLALIVLGVLAISSAFYTTLLSVVVIGAVLMVAGIVQVIQGFMAKKWTGLALSLLLGILYFVTGFVCVARPGVAAIAFTLWIAAFCFVAGLFRMLSSALQRFEHWGWVFFNGLITFILGILIFADWPISGLWVIGLFIGIDLVLAGWTWVLLACSAKKG